MTLQDSSHITLRDNGEPLVDLAHYGFAMEPIYYRQGFSANPKMYLRKSVADKLAVIQDSLPSGFRFKIWDGWRSREVQNTIYQHFYDKLQQEHPNWDEKTLERETLVFVAPATNPVVIPPHATGGAVDLTLVDSQGKELDMGTEFDHTGPEAGLFYYEQNNLNPEVRENRKILREAMSDAGFATYAGEWWDFNYGNHYWATVMGKTEAFYGEVLKSPSK